MSTSGIFSHDSFLVGIIIINHLKLKVLESSNNMANFINFFVLESGFKPRFF